jgi:mono/diheme cytochrome c family protein
MRFFAAPQGLAAILILASAAAAQAQDEHPKLPPGEGRDLMITTCSQCHDPERAATQRRDLAGFQALMEQMKGNGLEAPQGDLDIIAQYLAKSFPPSLPLPKP